MKRNVPVAEARAVAIRFLEQHRMPAEHAAIVADHLIYATMAGHDFAGFPRLPPLAAMLASHDPTGEIRILRETPVSAFIDGGDINGYVTSIVGMDKAIELARKSGIGVVSVRNSWFSGMLRYYVERAAAAGFVGMHAANSAARVAPHGGIDRLLGTNPISFAFPAPGEPLVIDFASASLMWGDVLYHQQIGRPLPEGRAVDAQGEPTTDPAAALAGAIRTFGEARGSALAMIVQALGILGGSDPVVREDGVWGYFFLALDPSILIPGDEYAQQIGRFREAVEQSRPVPGGPPVRTPGRSATANLATGRRRGTIAIEEAVWALVTGPTK